MSKIKLAVGFAASLCCIATLVWAASTIDPTQPPQGQPYNSAPIRDNFQSAVNDITALQGSNIGPSAPFPCNLANQGRWWINNTSPTAWVYNVCDGPGGQWDAIFTVNPQTHQVTGPPTTPGQRIILTAPITLYVLPSGNDTNNTCLVQSAPCGTLGNIFTRLRNNYDLAGLTPAATVQMLDGSYTENLNISGPFLGMVSPASIVINGNAGSPSNVTWNATDPITVSHGAYVTVQNLQLQASDDCISSLRFGQVNISNIIFAGCANNATHTLSQGQLSHQGPVIINAGGNCFARAQDFSLNSIVPVNLSANTVTLNNTPAFAQGFVCAGRLGQVRAIGAAFPGSGATGLRCNVLDNAVVYTGTAGNPTFFPGSSACVTSNGGVYD